MLSLAGLVAQDLPPSGADFPRQLAIVYKKIKVDKYYLRVIMINYLRLCSAVSAALNRSLDNWCALDDRVVLLPLLVALSEVATGTPPAAPSKLPPLRRVKISVCKKRKQLVAYSFMLGMVCETFEKLNEKKSDVQMNST